MFDLGKDLDMVSASVDRFYLQHGPCCAGCDWWDHANSVVGQCIRSAPVPGAQRVAMLGIRGTSAPTPAGHVLTPRDHHCGEFRDEFDWSTLPPRYLRRVGFYDRNPHAAGRGEGDSHG